KGAPRQQALQRAQGWLTSVGLGAFANRYPHMLSGGQRKRVGLAQVLIRDPKILLMDEPFGPLDAQTRQIMGNLLLELWNADRKAVLFVTHDLEEAIALSDRVVIMSAGPAARIIGDWKVKLPRPRDIAEVKIEPAFHGFPRGIWATLKAEVLRGYAQTGGGGRRHDLLALCGGKELQVKTLIAPAAATRRKSSVSACWFLAATILCAVTTAATNPRRCQWPSVGRLGSAAGSGSG